MEEQQATPQVVVARKRRAKYTAPENKDDLSSNGHRLLLGVLGILLPLMVYLAAGRRSWDGIKTPWSLLDSISGYYHTGGEAVFIGIVVALGIFLITYDGYDNPTGWKDRLASRIAGWSALVLAFYPTAVEGGYPALGWWAPYMRWLHLAGASLLFISFAYMSFFLFPIRDEEKMLDASKRRRNAVHRICGIVIMAGLGWAFVAGFVFERPIFWPETIMLVAFGISWLVKGKVQDYVRRMFGAKAG